MKLKNNTKKAQPKKPVKTTKKAQPKKRSPRRTTNERLATMQKRLLGIETKMLVIEHIIAYHPKLILKLIPAFELSYEWWYEKNELELDSWVEIVDKHDFVADVLKTSAAYGEVNENQKDENKEVEKQSIAFAINNYLKKIVANKK